MVGRLDLAELWDVARLTAKAKLEADGGPARTLPATCPFTVQELLARQPDPDAILERLAAG